MKFNIQYNLLILLIIFASCKTFEKGMFSMKDLMNTKEIKKSLTNNTLYNILDKEIEDNKKISDQIQHSLVKDLKTTKNINTQINQNKNEEDLLSEEFNNKMQKEINKDLKSARCIIDEKINQILNNSKIKNSNLEPKIDAIWNCTCVPAIIILIQE